LHGGEFRSFGRDARNADTTDLRSTLVDRQAAGDSRNSLARIGAGDIGRGWNAKSWSEARRGSKRASAIGVLNVVQGS